MFGLYLGQNIPFKNVYFHGMVNDEKNQKMSKSKGNVINPIDMSEKFGTDALRMSLIVGNPPGGSVPLSEHKVKGYKHFANKIWNITRFVLMNIENLDTKKPPKLLKKNQEYINEITQLSKEITKNLEELRFDFAADKIYHYVWHIFADVILEDCKQYLNEGSKEEKESTQWMLYEILCIIIKLLHPFMPFITETIWEHIPKGPYKKEELLLIEPWPEK